MNLKFLISKNNLIRLIDPAIYLINIVILIVLIIFINKNIYQTIAIQGSELKSLVVEPPKSINLDDFNAVINSLNSRRNEQNSVSVGNIF